MKLYAFIVFEILFLVSVVGHWIPYCLNQSSDLWFAIGVVSVFLVPIEVYHFIYKCFEIKAKEK
jgi:hypothetical protein